ncbi:putative ribosomal protein L25 [Candidatus Carsonella ruddii HT isolate Thao2000]|uniref:Putative ribosomal protein L25 n=1 Tax=Candidatus Carsonella ruddii HT isolate Thao2000 TaxID=1202539 RepID=J3VQ71_CARRU|nr:hypothetical protein [Candidatus Carsonella ruddii]AFP84086.1 putative ribosomal protein L25 [Candidatus Carsonella ruddii HT isolate Thao2000]
MKFKFKLKLYKKNVYNNEKIIFGDFILKKNIYNIYIIKKNFLKKIFKNNFLIVVYLNKKYFTYVKHVKYKHINNIIEYFILEEIKDIFYIKYENLKKKINNKIEFLNKKKFPRKIILNSIFKKKILKDNDFNFKLFLIKKKKLFFN